MYFDSGPPRRQPAPYSFPPPHYPPPQRDLDPLRLYRSDLRKASNRISWTILIAVLGMSFLSVTLFFLLGDFSFFSAFYGLSPELYYLILCFAYLVGMFLPFILFLSLAGISFSESVPFQRISAGTLVSCLSIGLSLCLLANYPANMVLVFLESFGYTMELPEYPQTNNLVANVFYIIHIAVIPPLVEEFAFRGVVLSRLKRYGNGFAIFASAFLFGIFHGNLIQFVFAFLVGLVLGYIVVQTKNLWLAVILHALNNGLSVTFAFLERQYGTEFSNTLYTIVLAAVLLLGLISFLVLAVKKHALLRVESSYQGVPCATRIGAFLLNPGLIALFLYFLITSILLIVPL